MPNAQKPEYVAIMKQVGANIRYHRQLAGLSQEQLGDKLGLTFQQVQKYERGVNRCGPAVMVNIAKHCRCTVMDLFKGTESDNLPAQTPQDIATGNLVARTARAMDALEPHQRDAFFKFINAMTGGPA